LIDFPLDYVEFNPPVLGWPTTYISAKSLGHYRQNAICRARSTSQAQLIDRAMPNLSRQTVE
jgi:hypothetical protein